MSTDRSSRGALTLPGEYYTSPSLYERETERIFTARWLYVCLSSELPGPGDYVCEDVEGESVIVVRGRDGEIRAYFNVCRHRGTQLCSAERGAFSKYIVCPYHSWAYDLDGRLVAAPNMDDVEGFDPETLPLRPIPTAVWEGFVLVNLAEDPEPIETALAPIMDKFTEWRLPELVCVHSTRYDVAANWKLLFQNYSECYHCPALHPVLNKLTPFKDSSNDLEEGPILGGPMRLSGGSDSMTMDGRTCAAPFPHLTEETSRLVSYYVVFPSFFLSLMPDYVLIHRIERRGPAASVISCDWLYRREDAERADFDASPAVEFWDMTNKQDWAICEAAQRGVSSRGYTPGPYSNLESMLAALDREYLAAMDG